MTPSERLRIQAEILDEVAQWSEQPEEPTGWWGLLSSRDLRACAAALRLEAEECRDA